MSKGIMGIKEVAGYLDMKEQTVYRLVQQKKDSGIENRRSMESKDGTHR